MLTMFMEENCCWSKVTQATECNLPAVDNMNSQDLLSASVVSISLYIPY